MTKKPIKKEVTKDPLTNKKKQNKQLMWAIVLMVCIILIIVLVPLIKYQFINKFVFLKLDFQKTQAGEMIFYSTRIPIGDMSGNIIGDFFINFRNDPRELKNIEVQKTTTTPVFSRDEVVYISNGEMTRGCGGDEVAAVLTLSGFLRQFALMNVSGAVNDQEIAKANDHPFVTCLNSPDNTVINIIEGDKTKITQTSPDCYTLEFKDCEVMEVSEKFILEILEGYMKGFEKREKWWQIF
jgi:hypothetical protein